MGVATRLLVHCVLENEIGFWKAKSPRTLGAAPWVAGARGRRCVICAVHAYLFPGGFSVNKPEIAFANVRYSFRQYNVYVSRTHP